MKKKLDIVSIGEILIDFVGKEPAQSLMDVAEFRRAAGGGPANMAVGAARMGMKSGFVGKIGDDAFGRHLAQTLACDGVNIDGLIVDTAAHTTLVFVALSDAGIPDFVFFRNGTADTQLRPEELPVQILQETRILHFSSVALTVEPARSACLQAVEIAREAGALISFDPNLRRPLWPDLTTARKTILEAAALADILKMNDEEYLFLTGETIETHVDQKTIFWNDRLILLAITRGEKGAVLYNGKELAAVPALPVNAVDTTGAGDAFMAGLLTMFIEAGQGGAPDSTCMGKIASWANIAAALTCQKSGGIPALPDRESIMQYIHSHPQ